MATDLNTLLHSLQVLNGMTNERVKTLPATELDHFLSTEFVCNEQTQETRTRAQASNNFQLLTRNCPETDCIFI